MTKILLIFGALLFIIVPLAGASTLTYLTDTLLSQYDLLQFGTILTNNGDYTEIQFRTTNNFQIGYPEDAISITIVPTDNSTSNSSTLIYFKCPTSSGSIIEGSMPLTDFWSYGVKYEYSIWQAVFGGGPILVPHIYAVNSYAPLSMLVGDVGQWTSTDEDIKLSQSCSFRADGQDVILYYGLFYKYDDSIEPLFFVSNDATSSLIQNISDSLSAGFDTIKIVLIAIGLLLLLFIIIFAYKLLAYFVNQVRGNKEEEQL